MEVCSICNGYTYECDCVNEDSCDICGRQCDGAHGKKGVSHDIKVERLVNILLSQPRDLLNDALYKVLKQLAEEKHPLNQHKN